MSNSENKNIALTRRSFLKTGVLASGATVLGGTSVAGLATENKAKVDKPSTNIDITIAGYPVDHVKALAEGRIQVQGCNVTFKQDKISDMNTHVFSGPQEYEISEIGLSPFMLAYANEGFRDYSLLPVFPIRLFRHKSVFIHTDRGIKKPGDLKGRKIGTPGYSSTSLTWIRGFMKHEYGVNPEDVEWVVSAADSSAKDVGKISKQEKIIPEGISLSVGPEGKDESDLLLDGDVDALFHAAEPKAFSQGHPKVQRLFSDARATERDYFKRTGVFPIMHAVAIRNDTAEKYPWLAEAVFNAYSQSKKQQYEAMNMKWIFGTLPWFGQELEETRELMGENIWPYGIEANRKTLESLFQYSYEQGLAKKQLTVEELFHPSSLKFSESL